MQLNGPASSSGGCEQSHVRSVPPWVSRASSLFAPLHSRRRRPAKCGDTPFPPPFPSLPSPAPLPLDQGSAGSTSMMYKCLRLWLECWTRCIRARKVLTCSSTGRDGTNWVRFGECKGVRLLGTEVYLTSPGPSEIGHNSFISQPILKPLRPVDSLLASESSDMSLSLNPY